MGNILKNNNKIEKNKKLDLEDIFIGQEVEEELEEMKEIEEIKEYMEFVNVSNIRLLYAPPRELLRIKENEKNNKNSR